ncbi:hypothetical protein BXY51_006188 [Actinoplanes cyaneus]|nr:hypothetical protein [Actinoplanes cyaneus]
MPYISAAFLTAIAASGLGAERRLSPFRCRSEEIVFGTSWRLQQPFSGWDNQMVAQMSLFNRAELAGMRDRTLSRNYSAEAEEFRREHERHRAWGLRQRHARKLVRVGWGASAAWAAVTAGDDQRRKEVLAPTKPAAPAASPPVPVAAPTAGEDPREPSPLPQPAPQHMSGSAAAASAQLAPRSPAPANAQLPPGSLAPANAQLAPGSLAPASAQLAAGRGQAGFFIVLVGWCVMVVKVALDEVECRRVRRGHRAVVQVRAAILGVCCCGGKVSGGRGPPTFRCAFSKSRGREE